MPSISIANLFIIIRVISDSELNYIDHCQKEIPIRYYVYLVITKVFDQSNPTKLLVPSCSKFLVSPSSINPLLSHNQNRSFNSLSQLKLFQRSHNKQTNKHINKKQQNLSFTKSVLSALLSKIKFLIEFPQPCNISKMTFPFAP